MGPEACWSFEGGPLAIVTCFLQLCVGMHPPPLPGHISTTFASFPSSLCYPLRAQAQQEEAYVDMAKCEEERELGNAAFKEARYPEAVGHYQEALKR